MLMLQISIKMSGLTTVDTIKTSGLLKMVKKSL